VNAIHVGCSGWNYRDWRERFYPKCLPARAWLAHYAAEFDTVEVNTTFYRLPKRESVAAWVQQTPPDFVFAVKASRYLTHIKRLTDMGQGVSRFYERIEPLVEAGRLGPVLWQLPPNFHRNDARLRDALACLPAGRHVFEFRHESWFAPEVLELLRANNVAVCIAHHPERPWAAVPRLTADFAFVRFHFGARGRRGNYSPAEIEEWASRIRPLAREAEVFAYFNNDWEGFAIANARAFRSAVS
jgi:uncharacterized protein YecE (DUF72 family)